MKWVAHMHTGERNEKGEAIIRTEKFDLPNTRGMADCRTAIIHASKTYKIAQEFILCVPDHE